MDEALTAKELSERLKITRTRLYYHLDLLEHQGIIRVVDERPVNGIPERRYRAVARAFRVDRTLLGSKNTTGDIVNAQAAILDAVAADLHANADRQDDDVLCARAFLRLTLQRRKELRARMTALLHEFEDAEPEGDDVEIALALFTTGGTQ
jgi:predicted ArsR family transcriptional regulator